MAPPTRTSRSRWIEEGLRALAAGGPDAVRIEPLARTLGVTRGGFYWHFQDRQALLDAMLGTWERTTTVQVAERLDREGGDATAKLRRLLALTSPAVVQTDLAIRDWARRDEAVAERLRRVDNRRMALLREMIGTFCPDADEVEARSLLAFCVAIGAHFLAADHDRRTRAQVLARATDLLLDRPVTTTATGVALSPEADRGTG
jgi:AcrR family transcriptional regulator